MVFYQKTNLSRYPVIPLSRYPDILGKVGGFIFSEENRYVPFSQFSLYFSPFLFF